MPKGQKVVYTSCEKCEQAEAVNLGEAHYIYIGWASRDEAMVAGPKRR